MCARAFKPSAWVVGVAVAISMIGCRSPSTALEAVPVQAPKSPSLLLTEVTVRALGPDVLAHVQASEAGLAAVRVDWSETSPPVHVHQERHDSVRIVLNPAFWSEHENLIEASVFAGQIDARKELRAFAIARAQQLRGAQPATSPPVAETFWEALGFSPMAFARLRERPEFQSRARALRHQALVWHLARAAARDLDGRADAEATDDDRRAAETTFALHGSPAPPLVTALLTAAVESVDETPSASVLLCRASDWIALGAQVIEADESFQQRLELSASLQRTVATMLKGLARLRKEGQCATTL